MSPVEAELARLRRAIVAKRRHLGWTQTELALRSGVDRRLVNRIERSDGFPSLRTLLRVTTSLGLTLRPEDGPEISVGAPGSFRRSEGVPGHPGVVG